MTDSTRRRAAAARRPSTVRPSRPERMLVSVYLPTKDRIERLRKAVDSVLGQTHRDLELIVIDDGSTDATADLLASVRDPRLRVERCARQGLTLALNRALEIGRASCRERVS